MIKIYANRKLERVKKALPVIREIVKNSKSRKQKAIVAGGDGFLLKILAEVANADIEIYYFPLGEHSGIPGFVIKDKKYLEKIFSDKIPSNIYNPSYLIWGNKPPAFNDIVIKTGAVARTIKIAFTVSGKKYIFEGDGIIVATPIGSTAYNMAAGGYVLPFNNNSVVITPLLPCRSFSDGISVYQYKGNRLSPDAEVKAGYRINSYISQDKKIKIEILKRQGDIHLAIDGKSFYPVKGDEIIMERRKAKCRLVLPYD